MEANHADEEIALLVAKAQLRDHLRNQNTFDIIRAESRSAILFSLSSVV